MAGDADSVGRALNAHVDTVASTIGRGAALSILDALQRNTPVSKGPQGGRLKRSWRISGTGVNYQITNDAGYLSYVREGHGWITPKSAKVLRFQVWPSGDIIYTLKVRPVAPNDFVERSMEEAAREGPSYWIMRLL